jgi:signal transduction histidine kinase
MTLRTLVPRGFAVRLGLATSLLLVVVSATQSWVFARLDMDQLRAYVSEQGRTVSTHIARAAAPLVLSGRMEPLARLAEDARAQHGLEYARIFNRHGLLLAAVGTTPAEDPTEDGWSTVVGDVWEFRSAMPDGGGTVTIGVPVSGLSALRRRKLETATLLTLACTLLGVLAALAMARAITRPLRALMTAADMIALGDLNARVDYTGSGELGRVARSFNAMARSLARSRTSVEEKVHELEEASHLKSEFVATVSHELRTPLHVILGYVEMLAEGAAGPLNDEQAAMLQAIDRYSRDQLHLITSVLDFSRLSTGRVSLQIEHFDLAPMLAEFQAWLTGVRGGENIALTVAVAPDVPPLETDRIKLQEVVRNLVDNAVKFTQDGIVSVDAWVGPQPGWVTIEVVDTGPGIDPAELPYIFDAFRQVGRSATRGTNGVGLGLSIVKQLVDVLGGRVTVTSTVGEGCRFRVEVPSSLEPVEALDTAVAALDAVASNRTALERTTPAPSPAPATGPVRPRLVVR